MFRILSVITVLLWLAPTSYLAVVTYWIVASARIKSPPYLFLAGLMAVLGIWWFVSRNVLAVARRLWKRA